MDITMWVTGVTTLAGLAKSWLDLKKSGTDLQRARAELAKIADRTSSAVTQNQQTEVKTVIDSDLPGGSQPR